MSGQMGPTFLVTIPDENEFAVFSHVKGKVYTDFNEVRQEIEAETDRLGGKKVRFLSLIAAVGFYDVSFL
jgi:hypothetical protein